MGVESTKSASVRSSFAEITGEVEQALAMHPGPDSARALWLLKSLAHLWRDTETVRADDLTLGEFDACLADLHASLFGATLPCEADCKSCEERFEFQIDLDELRRAVEKQAEGYETNADGVVTAPSRRRFRLPRVADLARIRDEDWLKQFLVEGEYDAAALEGEMEAAACVLSQDIEAPCPECGKSETIRFDIARYLIETLRGESAFLWREVHLLARQYGWALSEIMPLTRSVRRQLAGLIAADARAQMRLAS